MTAPDLLRADLTALRDRLTPDSLPIEPLSFGTRPDRIEIARWVRNLLSTLLAAHTPPSETATEPCDECETTGRNCPEHSAPPSSSDAPGWDVGVGAVMGSSSDADRDTGLSEGEREALCAPLWESGCHGFVDDHPGLFAAVERILAARDAARVPEGRERVDYVIDWISNGPHPTRWTGQQSTRPTLEEARDFATWKHVHNPKITRRTTFTKVEPVALVEDAATRNSDGHAPPSEANEVQP